MNTMTCWDLAQAAIHNGATRILLTGPRGVAKSRWGTDILRHTHQAVSQCSLNEDIAVQELLGHYIPKDAAFEWHDGPVMAAYRNGGGLVANEIGRASGAVQDMFLAVLDDPSISMISLANGENVRPGETFQVIATSNASAETLDHALQDRFDAIISITTPHPGLIAHLNSQRGGLGTIIERSYSDPQRSISPRRALAFISYTTHGLDEDVAAALAFGKNAKDILTAVRALSLVEPKVTA